MHPPRTLHSFLNHYFTAEFNPSVAVALDPSPAELDDIEICDRLIQAFHRTIEFEFKHISPDMQPSDGLWETIKNAYHGEGRRLLALRDPTALAGYLNNGFRTDLCYGLGMFVQVFNAMNDPEGRRANLLILIDRIVSLAESLGVLPCENPEQGRYGENMLVDPVQTVFDIEAKLGISIRRPKIMGNFGIQIEGDVIDFRVPDDAYCIHKIKHLYQSTDLHVSEIGGGFGGMALFAVRAGVSHYLIIDLPFVNVIQGYFLIKALGGAAVCLFGERNSGAQVEILPYWEFFDRGRRFDIVFNRDSLPEIPRRQVDEYLAEIERRRVPLLSINQESEELVGSPDLRQLNIGRIIAQRGSMKRESRQIYWIRRGYVEELFLPA